MILTNWNKESDQESTLFLHSLNPQEDSAYTRPDRGRLRSLNQRTFLPYSKSKEKGANLDHLAGSFNGKHKIHKVGFWIQKEHK